MPVLQSQHASFSLFFLGFTVLSPLFSSSVTVLQFWDTLTPVFWFPCCRPKKETIYCCLLILVCFMFTLTYKRCPTVDTVLRLADPAKQGQCRHKNETSRDTVQLKQCINSSHFSFLCQTHWPVPKADAGKMMEVNYSGMFLICKSVLLRQTALFVWSVWVFWVSFEQF